MSKKDYSELDTYMLMTLFVLITLIDDFQSEKREKYNSKEKLNSMKEDPNKIHFLPSECLSEV